MGKTYFVPCQMSLMERFAKIVDRNVLAVKCFRKKFSQIYLTILNTPAQREQ